jgi:8-oxo-dGTP pyrophosphatase MutT (NUDIX family)
VAAVPLPSATVVLLRDAERRLELLLLQRAGREDRPGPWVFPGGKVEPDDVRGGDPSSLGSALRAAIRETREEAGLDLGDARLHPISRWITPEMAPKRFDAWFFLAALESVEEVRVDGSEMVAHRWLAPGEALEAHRAGEIRLAPPTFVTVTWLSGHASAASALRALRTAEPLVFEPRNRPVEGGAVMLYPGDAGYLDGDLERPGPRHRLISTGSGYRYERSGA